jgi:hypothetical protein
MQMKIHLQIFGSALLFRRSKVKVDFLAQWLLTDIKFVINEEIA